MKKKLLVLTALVFALCNLFCAEISVAINPGTQWQERAPQVAVWIEDEDENYVATVFVTKGASKKAWKFSPKDGRPDSLPAWYASSKVNPAKASNSTFDAVTSATPKNGIVTNANVTLQIGKTYIVKTEVNQSFDYNESYTKKNSGVDGQPSVLYKGSFVYSDNTPEVTLHFYGTGTDGNNSGASATSNLTTAKSIIASVYVTVK